MIQVTAKDALRALKKFKRLAKQDLLASQLTPDPDFWRLQAEARRTTYDVLMQLVKNEGVEAAHRYAVDELATLPLFGSGEHTASIKGKQQALQMLFSMLGVEHPVAKERPSVSDSDDDEPLRLEASS